MRIGLGLLKQESVNRLRQALVTAELSCNGLARSQCLADGWLNPKHGPCVASAARDLLQAAFRLGLSPGHAGRASPPVCGSGCRLSRLLESEVFGTLDGMQKLLGTVPADPFQTVHHRIRREAVEGEGVGALLGMNRRCFNLASLANVGAGHPRAASSHLPPRRRAGGNAIVLILLPHPRAGRLRKAAGLVQRD